MLLNAGTGMWTGCDEIFYTGDVTHKTEEITERVNQFIQEVALVDFEKE